MYNVFNGFMLLTASFKWREMLRYAPEVVCTECEEIRFDEIISQGSGFPQPLII